MFLLLLDVIILCSIHYTVKGITSRSFRKKQLQTHTKIIPLSHHLWLTSVWLCLYLQRPCPLPVFSYFAAFGKFLGVNLCAVGYSPQPITALRVWGAGLKKIATGCQILAHDTTRSACTLSWGGGANFECCVYKQQPRDPTHYTFNSSKNTFCVCVFCWISL